MVVSSHFMLHKFFVTSSSTIVDCVLRRLCIIQLPKSKFDKLHEKQGWDSSNNVAQIYVHNIIQIHKNVLWD
jgi:hypothetical protein